MQRSPFKNHRFPPEVVLCAVRWHCRDALSCRDGRGLLAELGIEVDASTVHRWVRKSGPEIAKRTLDFSFIAAFANSGAIIRHGPHQGVQ